MWSRRCPMYDSEERTLFWIACRLGISVDRAYGMPVVRWIMRLSASFVGRDVKRPR